MRIRRTCASLAGLLLAGASLSGCSGDEPAEADGAPAESSDAAQASSTPSLEVPEGISLTDEGSELGFGDAAEVAWQPREGKVGAIEIRVDEVERVTLDEFAAFRVDRSVRTATPYFVSARIENVGDTFLGNTGVPLYLLDEADTLIERSTFGSSFEACPSEPLPARFEPGATTETCLVFLVPERGEAQAVSFRPTEEFEPITWAGEITEPRRRGQDRQGQGRQGRQGRD